MLSPAGFLGCRQLPERVGNRVYGETILVNSDDPQFSGLNHPLHDRAELLISQLQIVPHTLSLTSVAALPTPYSQWFVLGVE